DQKIEQQDGEQNEVDTHLPNDCRRGRIDDRFGLADCFGMLGCITHYVPQKMTEAKSQQLLMVVSVIGAINSIPRPRIGMIGNRTRSRGPPDAGPLNPITRSRVASWLICHTLGR